MGGWLRFENSTAENPKLVPLSDRAFRLWFSACCYCSRNKADGLVPRAIAASLSRTGSRRVVDELVAAGRFEPVGDTHYRVHDYLKHNPQAQPEGSVIAQPESSESRASKTRKERGAKTRKERASGDAQREGSELVDLQLEVKDLKPLTTSQRQSQHLFVADPEIRREADKHPDAARLCRLFADLIRQRDPKARVTPDADGWVRDMRLLIADRGGDVVEVERVVRWSQADSFWQGVILSPRKLREKFTQLLLKSQRGSSGNGRRASAGDLVAKLRDAEEAPV